MNKKRTVVLVGGFAPQRGAETLKVLAGWISSLPDTEVFIPEYFERYGMLGQFFREKTIPEYAAVVYDKIICHLTDPCQGLERTIVVVGYSMGGLVAQLVVEMGLLVKAAIIVGGPNRGIRVSDLPLRKRLLLKIKTPPCVVDMEEGSDFLKMLNKIPPSGNRYYIGSTKDEIVPLESSIPPGIAEARKRIVYTSHSGLIPKSDKNKRDISISAIPDIIEIIKKEFT